MIEFTHLLRGLAPVQCEPLRPQVVTHRHRPGFVERQDGSWICLPVHARSQNKPKARRRLWHWLASLNR